VNYDNKETVIYVNNANADKNTDSGVRIGVYICHCGLNIASRVDVEKTVQFASGLPGVSIAREYKFMCSDPGQELIKKDIRSGKINRVVVASCSPLMHEKTFRNASEQGGINPFYFQMASIREHVSWVTPDGEDATKKACALVAAAVSRVRRHQELERRTVKVRPEVLVVGAGIAGISAALTLADSDRKVYLVEREPTIGGNMARFDKTFPTLDCSSCILTPKMTQAGSHPDIKLMTYSEVESVSGSVGDFHVRIRRKARHIDEAECNGCGECAKVCPVQVPSEFDMNLCERTAAYRSFPQAIPCTYTIDRLGISPCSAKCPAGIPAHAYVALARAGRYTEAFNKVVEQTPFVATLGRTCPATCETECSRKQTGRSVSIRLIKRYLADLQAEKKFYKPEPAEETGKKINIIGAGPAGLTAAFHLAMCGHEVHVFDASERAGGTPGLMIPSFRLPDAALEQDIEIVKNAGVRIITEKKITGPDISRMLDSEADAVLVAAGAMRSRTMNIPGNDMNGVIDSFDFLKKTKAGAIENIRDKNVAVVGGGNAAIDSARTALRLGAGKVSILYRRSRNEMPAWEEEIKAAEEEGVELRLLCVPVECRGKSGLEDLVVQEMELGEPDESGRARPVPVKGSEESMQCDILIPAIGADPDLENLLPEGVETEYGRIAVDKDTCATSLKGLFAAGDAVLGPSTIAQAVGMATRAAKGISNYLYTDVDDGPHRIMGGHGGPPLLQNKNDTGVMDPDDVLRRVGPLPGDVPLPDVNLKPEERKKDFSEAERGFDSEEIRSESSRCLDCAVCCDCRSCVAACEAGAVVLDQEDRIEEIDVGVIIVATGFRAFDPSGLEEYGYGRFPNVYTSLEVERLSNATGPTQGQIKLKDGSVPESVAILHCIGSRDRNTHEYCSRACCMASLKLAHLVREKSGAEITNFYIDMRTFGKGYEEFYHKVLEEGVRFIRGKAAEVVQGDDADPDEKGKLVVRAEDTLTNGVVRVPVDMVILAVGMEPQTDAVNVARTFGLSLSRDGFLLERHPKLGPAGTFMDGVFIAGSAQGPKDIVDTVAHAGAAGHEALSLCSRGEFDLEPVTSMIDPDLCAACGRCVDVCAFGALSLDTEANRAVLNEALCKGCGLCAAVCPSGAADQRHFTSRQIAAEVMSLVHI